MENGGTDNSSDCQSLNGDEEQERPTNLIVNYLPQDMTVEEIRSLFCSVGEIDSCRLIRDKDTRLSLGYAFVNYKNPEHAEKALSHLNKLRLRNKMIKVSVARPSSNEIKNANLYICGLPKTLTEDELVEIFREFGKIITYKILTDRENKSRGVGFIRFDKRREAQAACDDLNGTVPKALEKHGAANNITVKFANPPNAKDKLPVTPPEISIGVSPFSLARAGKTVGLGPMFHQPPNVRFSPLPLLPSYGGLNTAQAAAAAAVSPTLNGSTAAWSTTTNSQSEAHCLFVYNLPSDAKDDLLYKLFSPFGAIYSVKVIMDPNSNTCKGFGFVNMANYIEAYSAMRYLDGYEISPSRHLQVSFKTSGGKKERQ